MFDGNFEEINFKTPSLVSGGFLNIYISLLDLIERMSCSLILWRSSSGKDQLSEVNSCSSVSVSVFLFSLVQLDMSSSLQLLCLAEDMRTDPWDISSLLRLNGCDIRQSLLQLQFWTRSGGGRSTTRPLTHTDRNGKEVKRWNNNLGDKVVLLSLYFNVL